MNYKTMRRVGINEPIDGFLDIERDLAILLAENTIYSLYNKLPTPRMKFIVAAHFELGYPQEDVAVMLGVSQPSLIDEINLIRRVLLGKPYRPRKTKRTIKQEELLKTLIYLNS